MKQVLHLCLTSLQPPHLRKKNAGSCCSLRCAIVGLRLSFTFSRFADVILYELWLPSRSTKWHARWPYCIYLVLYEMRISYYILHYVILHYATELTDNYLNSKPSGLQGIRKWGFLPFVTIASVLAANASSSTPSPFRRARCLFFASLGDQVVVPDVEFRAGRQW